MKRAVILVLLSACVPEPPTSGWNGVWLSSANEGVLVYDQSDGGVAFGPRQLSVLDGGMVLTQRCIDFDVTSAGRVSLPDGKLSGGTVTEVDGGFDLTFANAALISRNAWALTLADGRLTFRVSGSVRGSQFTLTEDWVRSDGAIDFTTRRQFEVLRLNECR